MQFVPYLVLVRANQRLLVIVHEKAVFQTEVSWFPAGEVLALLHKMPLSCHTWRTNELAPDTECKQLRTHVACNSSLSFAQINTTPCPA